MTLASPAQARDWGNYGYQGDQSGAAYHAELVENAGATSGSPSKAYGLGMSVCQMRASHTRNDMLRLLEPQYGVTPSIAVVMGAEFHSAPPTTRSTSRTRAAWWTRCTRTCRWTAVARPTCRATSRRPTSPRSEGRCHEPRNIRRADRLRRGDVRP